MTKRNELLEEDILKTIEKARYVASEEDKDRKSLLYIIVLVLVTLAVVLSLVMH